MIRTLLDSTKPLPSTGLDSVSIQRIQGIGYGVLWFLGARIRRIFLDGYSVLVVRIVIFKISSFKLQNAGPKAFKIFDHWFLVPGFDSLINNSWSEGLYNGMPDIILKNKLKKLKADNKDWNYSNRVESNRLKEESKKRIFEWDQKAELGSLLPNDVDAIEELLIELMHLDQTDRNSLKQKKRKQAINGLIWNGSWTEDIDTIKNATFSHYEDRFKESTHRRPKFHSSLFRKLEAVDATFLEASISMDEMKEVVWSCSGSKSPGPDGINFNLLRSVIWVNTCMKSASISVLVNGSPSREFKMERGLRQGDPFSPFLFLIVGEALQVLILEAYDALFFGEWSYSNANTLVRILKCFQDVSGLKVNLSKSRLYGVGVPLNEVASVAEAINCAHDKFLNRLSSWKSKLMSIGGRSTLVKAVLGSLPLNHFSLFRDPIKIIKRLEVIRSRFFWGFNEDSRKMVWINWNKTIMEKGMGGLGVRSIRAKNLSLLGKWTWRFHTEDTVLWRKVIKEIYGPDGGFSHMAHQGSRMGLWSEIVKSNKYIKKLEIPLDNPIVRKIRSGEQT
ncbi:hypothetical protein Tco_0885926 [Tanacetum coccineum]